MKAIVYTSNTGFTARYAKMLGEETGLAVYELEKAEECLEKGTEIILFAYRVYRESPNPLRFDGWGFLDTLTAQSKRSAPNIIAWGVVEQQTEQQYGRENDGHQKRDAVEGNVITVLEGNKQQRDKVIDDSLHDVAWKTSCCGGPAGQLHREPLHSELIIVYHTMVKNEFFLQGVTKWKGCAIMCHIPLWGILVLCTGSLGNI